MQTGLKAKSFFSFLVITAILITVNFSLQGQMRGKELYEKLRTILLIHELLKRNKMFDLMIYPEQQHGIRYDQYRKARIEYFIRHLKPDVK